MRLSCKPDYGKALESHLPCHICKLSLNLQILICRYSHRFSHSRMCICNLRKKGHRRPVHAPNYAKQQSNRTQAIAAERCDARYNSA